MVGGLVSDNRGKSTQGREGLRRDFVAAAKGFAREPFAIFSRWLTNPQYPRPRKSRSGQPGGSRML